MEEKILFERFLFEDDKEITINDIEFFVDRIVMLPKIRPHKLDKAVSLSVEYCHKSGFHQKIIDNADICPVLIYRLFKRGVLLFEEIKSQKMCFSYLLSYYFHREIEDFDTYIKSKSSPKGFDTSFINNEFDIDQLIEYGFLPSSIEYILKYDVIDDLVVFDNLNQKAKWSPFEWSMNPQCFKWSLMPEYLDLLSFAGFFGSIKCFKHLLMKGFKINENVLSMVVCSGSFDLYHLCQVEHCIIPILVCEASKFLHLQLLVFLVENGYDINSKDKDNKF